MNKTGDRNLILEDGQQNQQARSRKIPGGKMQWRNVKQVCCGVLPLHTVETVSSAKPGTQEGREQAVPVLRAEHSKKKQQHKA